MRTVLGGASVADATKGSDPFVASRYADAMSISVVHHTDPGCPWAYSAEPHLRALEWRYGDGLEWRTVLIGLTESAEQYVARGYTGDQMTKWNIEFRNRFRMPYSTDLREGPAGTGMACRLVVSARLQGYVAGEALLRALRFSWFTNPRRHDSLEVLEPVVRSVSGIDTDAVLAGLDDPEVEALYQADRAEARSVAPPASAQGKTAQTDGPERYTAPSLVFEHDGRTLVAAGWQSLAAYDVCIANLDPTLTQRGPAGPDETLPAFPRGLVTCEVALLMCARNDDPNLAVAEQALVDLVAAGKARRVALGNDALWLPV